MAYVATGGRDWQGITGAIVFLPVAVFIVYWFFKPKPALVIDDTGIRSGVFGWEVHWDEVTRAGLFRMRFRWFTARALVLRVRDPERVVRRLPPRRRKGRRARRVREAVERHGVRFGLHYLDTPRDEVLAAVERYVPVER